jgi:hypothetical protein
MKSLSLQRRDVRVGEINDPLVSNANTTETYEELIAIFPESVYRFPFHVLVPEDTDQLILELNEKSLPQLFPLYRPLELSSDWFYAKVVDKMIFRLETSLASAAQDEQVGLTFSEFKPLLLKIRDFSTSLQLTFILASTFKNPQDSINAFKLAIHIADRSIQNSANKVCKLNLLNYIEH